MRVVVWAGLMSTTTNLSTKPDYKQRQIDSGQQEGKVRNKKILGKKTMTEWKQGSKVRHEHNRRIIQRIGRYSEKGQMASSEDTVASRKTHGDISPLLTCVRAVIMAVFPPMLWPMRTHFSMCSWARRCFKSPVIAS